MRQIFPQCFWFWLNGNIKPNWPFSPPVAITTLNHPIDRKRPDLHADTLTRAGSSRLRRSPGSLKNERSLLGRNLFTGVHAGRPLHEPAVALKVDTHKKK